jgi:hypothetical protein
MFELQVNANVCKCEKKKLMEICQNELARTLCTGVGTIKWESKNRDKKTVQMAKLK